MELTWYGRTCVRLRGRDAVVVADPYQSVVGPTGRGIAAEIVTFSHPDDNPLPRAKGRTSRDGSTVLPTSLESAFVIDSPGEYEVRNVLITAVRTFRDDKRGTVQGRNLAFVIELDNVHTIHLGDIGHLFSEEKLTDIGPIDVACLPVGGALNSTGAAELVAQLDPRIVVPMPVSEDERANEEAIAKFLHEMGVTGPLAAQAKLTVTPSGLPAETTTVILESRGKV
ncbi:MAG: MBL fold metallo-hydrolase [Candidatus Limnocylindrales bacterium]